MDELPWMIGQAPAMPNVVRPRLFYWNTADQTWRPVGELASLSLVLPNLGTIELHFKRIDMTDADFDEIDASEASHAA